MTNVGEAGAAGRVEILGRVRDIQPSKDAPTLELYFDRQHADCFPTENRGSVTLSHGGEDWRGTIGITGNNPLYLHTKLTNAADKVAVTHWLRQVGVQEGGSLRFRVHARGRLQLLEVVDVGSWREDNNYGVRAEWLRAESDPRPSAPPLRREPERRLEYREALEGLRDAGGVQEQDLARLAKLRADLELSPESVERIEREVLGSPAHEAASKAMHASQTLSGGMTIDPSAAPPSCQGPDIEPGAVIDGRFEIQRLLGAGGMGRVFLARDVRLDEPVAIKFVRAEHATNPSVVERLRREVRLCRPLSHRAIVRVHDFHESADGLPFVSMEFVEGQTLRDWLDRHDHRVAVTQACSLLAMVCEGLAYAHGEGVVHLDLKPDNIMVDEGLARARILDFGIGKASGREGLDSSQVGTGTPYYMAPEQERSDGVDHRADVFSFGAIAYEVLVGIPPRGRFRAPHELRVELPAVLGDLIMGCMDQDREQRPGLGELQQALMTGTGASRPAVVRGKSAASRQREKARSRSGLRNDRSRFPPRWIFLGAAAAIAMLTIVGFALLGGDDRSGGGEPPAASTEDEAEVASRSPVVPPSNPNGVSREESLDRGESEAGAAAQPIAVPGLLQGESMHGGVSAKTSSRDPNPDSSQPTRDEKVFLAPIDPSGLRKRASSGSGLLDTGAQDEGGQGAARKPTPAEAGAPNVKKEPWQKQKNPPQTMGEVRSAAEMYGEVVWPDSIDAAKKAEIMDIVGDLSVTGGIRSIRAKAKLVKAGYAGLFGILEALQKLDYKQPGDGAFGFELNKALEDITGGFNARYAAVKADEEMDPAKALWNTKTVGAWMRVFAKWPDEAAFRKAKSDRAKRRKG